MHTHPYMQAHVCAQVSVGIFNLKKLGWQRNGPSFQPIKLNQGIWFQPVVNHLSIQPSSWLIKYNFKHWTKYKQMNQKKKKAKNPTLFEDSENWISADGLLGEGDTWISHCVVVRVPSPLLSYSFIPMLGTVMALWADKILMKNQSF